MPYTPSMPRFVTRPIPMPAHGPRTTVPTAVKTESRNSGDCRTTLFVQLNSKLNRDRAATTAGRELELAAAEYNRALDRFSGPGQAPGQSRAELRRSLGGIILAYTDLLCRREAAFDSLYSFLVVGIFIQSFALMVTLGRVGTAREEILRRDTMLA
jgi:hypothetical protein